MRSATVKHPATYVPPVDECPYMIEKPDADRPKYFKTFKAAQALLRKDIEWFRDTWTQLNIKDSQLACIEALKLVDGINPFEGGAIDIVIDPYTGMRYRANLVRRQTV